MIFLITALHALLILIRLTNASPMAQADPTRTNPCPYSLFSNQATRTGHAYPQVTWSDKPDNIIKYPLKFDAANQVAPSPASCMMVQGMPYCLEVAANAMANGIWKGMGAGVVAAAVCPTPAWNTVGITHVQATTFPGLQH
ncbi:hypothetical protein E2P81_ATG06440 [Venturia nashicola]|uniref:Uncharacterized protein n=1 Tax=Venturia nashicola TaxID=86259 RepID=A0A4Z1P3H9_9PEZI|nr:hypothetical protein E6O75_ATG06601 [Venturia nashicola]TLD28094.1 hypothetical protein E2P81_ATG06440 [Venturia nashicola]